jgi:hypothetical protein
MVDESKQATGDAWGDNISPDQQAELQGHLDRWQAETDHGERKGPFDYVYLSAADAFWLAVQSGRDEYSYVPNLHLAGANLSGAHLEGANLRAAHLEDASLNGAHLERADLTEAHLEGARLIGTWFDKASYLNDAILTGVSLDQASFDQTNLTVVDWSLVTTLGDEQTARTSKYALRGRYRPTYPIGRVQGRYPRQPYPGRSPAESGYE